MYDGPSPDTGIFYSYRMPRSQMLVEGCTKEWAREQVRRGLQPKGSIWIPGTCTGKDQDRNNGDLFGPDAEWRPARPLDAVPETHTAWRKP